MSHLTSLSKQYAEDFCCLWFSHAGYDVNEQWFIGRKYTSVRAALLAIPWRVTNYSHKCIISLTPPNSTWALIRRDDELCSAPCYTEEQLSVGAEFLLRSG